MTARFDSRIINCTALLCFGLFYSVAGITQDTSNEAILASDASITIPTLKVGEKFYEVKLASQAHSWTVATAVKISPVVSELLTGSFENQILDLPCVLTPEGQYYSAQLVNANPASYDFSLASATVLNYCATPTGIAPPRGKWLRTTDAVLSARVNANLAWTGEEIVVVGGTQEYCADTASCIAPLTPVLPFADGAAYSPLTDTWRKIADAPVGFTESSTATIGGDIYILARNYNPASLHLLRYRSSQDQWDEFTLPVSSGSLAIATHESGVVLYSTSDANGSTPDWQLNSSTRQWTQLPASPLEPGYNRQYVAFGEDLYLFDHALGGASGPSYLRAARLRQQQWVLLPVADSIGNAPELISGGRLIAPVLGCRDDGAAKGHDHCVPYGAIFDTETDTWQELSTPAGYVVKNTQSPGGLSDNGLILFQAGRPALDAVTNEWFRVPLMDMNPNNYRSIRAAGPYGFVFGGVSGRNLLQDAWIWQP